MTRHTFDLMNPAGALGQAGYLSPHGYDERQPLEQLRREQLKQLAIQKGFEVTDSHRKDDLLLVLRSGIRMQQRQAPPPPLPHYDGGGASPAPAKSLQASEADEEAARASALSEVKAMKFMKLKAVAKQYGLDCPAGMTAAQKHTLCEAIVKHAEEE